MLGNFYIGQQWCLGKVIWKLWEMKFQIGIAIEVIGVTIGFIGNLQEWRHYVT